MKLIFVGLSLELLLLLTNMRQPPTCCTAGYEEEDAEEEEKSPDKREPKEWQITEWYTELRENNFTMHEYKLEIIKV